MNAPVRLTDFRAPPELERRLFTVSDVVRMEAVGVFGPEDRYELWEGEIIPMAPKGVHHEVVKRDLAEWLILRLEKRFWVGVETSLFLSETTYVDPDIVIYPRSFDPKDVRGADVLLLVEIADTSLAKDLGSKAMLCAKHNVGHYWLIEAQNRRTHAFSAPGREGYASAQVFEDDVAIPLPFAPEISVKLSDLG